MSDLQELKQFLANARAEELADPADKKFVDEMIEFYEEEIAELEQ